MSLKTWLTRIYFFLSSIQGQGNCLIGCLCYPFCAGCYRSGVQRTLGVVDTGAALNCLLHVYLYVAKITSSCTCVENLERLRLEISVPWCLPLPLMLVHSYHPTGDLAHLLKRPELSRRGSTPVVPPPFLVKW